jgi:hypothetical protein
LMALCLMESRPSRRQRNPSPFARNDEALSKSSHLKGRLSPPPSHPPPNPIPNPPGFFLPALWVHAGVPTRSRKDSPTGFAPLQKCEKAGSHSLPHSHNLEKRPGSVDATIVKPSWKRRLNHSIVQINSRRPSTLREQATNLDPC